MPSRAAPPDPGSGTDPQPASVLSGPPLVAVAYGRTDPGRVRANNEDQFAIAEMAKPMHVQQSSLADAGIRTDPTHAHLFVVADGLGGYAGGELASRITVTTVEECLL